MNDRADAQIGSQKMQRKLVNHAVFEELQGNSNINAQYELMEAENILSQSLDMGSLAFNNFNSSHVFYETENNSYIRANYQINENNITFDNIEEIVIDEQSQNEGRKSSISKMLDAILEDNLPKATTIFGEVMDGIREQQKRETIKANRDKMNEVVRARRDPRHPNRLFVSRNKAKRQKNSSVARKRAAKASWVTRRRNDPGLQKQARNRRMYHKIAAKAARLAGRRGKSRMHEWNTLADNVFGYIDFVENNNIITEAVQTDNNGAVIAVNIPTSKVRNEGKILQYGLKTLKVDLKIMRESARRLSLNREFCEMLSNMKRHNNLSDNEALEESINQIVTKFPNVLYLTHSELSSLVGEALSSLGVTNYDDTTCSFMSEGILRVAHNAYADRVSRIHRLANVKQDAECEDPFLKFQEMVGVFYPSLDEALAVEMQVFEDLHTAVVDIRRIAEEIKDEELTSEANEHVVSLETILNGENLPSLQVAAEVATWLEALVAETNLETGDWNVEKTPHETITGEHPDMAKKASKGYAPNQDFSGDWGDAAPQIDGDKKGYKGGAPDETRNHSWGNKGGSNVWPALNNPYVPKAGDATMKGEKGVDKDVENADGMWQSGDTWPSLQNPYVPKSVKVHVSNDNKVDD